MDNSAFGNLYRSRDLSRKIKELAKQWACGVVGVEDLEQEGWLAISQMPEGQSTETYYLSAVCAMERVHKREERYQNQVVDSAIA
jgi:hypothetical protein